MNPQGSKKLKFWLTSSHRHVLVPRSRFCLCNAFSCVFGGDSVSYFSFNLVDFCCLPRWCLSFLDGNQFPSIFLAHCRLPPSLHTHSAFTDISDPIRSHPRGADAWHSLHSPPGTQPGCLLLCFLPRRRFSLRLWEVLNQATLVSRGCMGCLYLGGESRFHCWFLVSSMNLMLISINGVI